MIAANDRYDSLLAFYFDAMGAKWGFADDPSVDWRLAKAQVRAESNFKADARSPVGALGLLQLMPAVDLASDGKRDADNPEECIKEGLNHLGYLWKMFAAEAGLERWKFALGAYNCGPGYIIAAQAILAGRQQPTDQWVYIATVLHEAEVKGKRPDALQTKDYVRKILAEFLAVRVARPEPPAWR